MVKTPLDIRRLSTEQKIGMMLFARTPVDREDLEFLLSLVRNHSLGGVHVSGRFAYRCGMTVEELASLICNTADYPVLIADDMENGYPAGTRLPSQMMICNAGDPELAYYAGRITGAEAREQGFNLVFGPVLDIALNRKNSSVGVRAFSSDLPDIMKFGEAYIKGCQEEGMVVTAKHFPGVGACSGDPHIGLPVLDADYNTLVSRELVPFISAIRNAGLSGIMMGHIMVPSVDNEYPATLSSKLVGLLRDLGFDGLVITDSLSMFALLNSYPSRMCYQKAMTAGNDMVLVDYRISCRESYERMLEIYRQGMISDLQIEAAATRVLAAQSRTFSPQGKTGLSPEFIREKVSKMNTASIIDRRRSGASGKLEDGNDLLFIFQKGVMYINPVTGVTERTDYDFSSAKAAVERYFPKASTTELSEYPSKPETEDILRQTSSFGRIVFVVAVRSVSYQGSVDLSERLQNIISGLGRKVSAVLYAGCPIGVEDYINVSRIIYFSEEAESQSEAVRILSGYGK